MKKIIVVFILVLFFSMQASAEVARIRDKDGTTNVRSGKGTEFPVVAALDMNDLFFCDRSGDEWIKITALTKYTQPINGINVEGYVHRSRIEFLADMDNGRKKALLEKTFTTYGQLIGRVEKLGNAADRSKKPADYGKASNALQEKGSYSDSIYSSVLEILPIYLKQTKDMAMLQRFFSIMWADSGSANEVPSIEIAECFVDQPDFVIGQIQLLKNREQRTMVFDAIEHGLDIYSDNRSANELKALEKLQNKLKNARKR